MLLLRLALALAPVVPVPVSVGAADPTDLFLGLERAEEIEIRATDAVWEGGLSALAEELGARVGKRVVRVAPGARGEPEEEQEGAADRPRILFGGPDDRVARRVAEGLGLELLDAGGFRLGRLNYPAAFDSCVVVGEDPERPGLPVTLVYARREETLRWMGLGLDLRWRPGWAAWRRGDLERRSDAHGRVEDLTRARASLVRGVRTLEGRGWAARLVGFGERPDPSAYAEVLDEAVGRVRDWAFREDVRAGRVMLELYPDEATRAARGLPAAPYHIDPAGRVHVVVGEGPHDGGAGAALAAALAWRGSPAAWWIAEAAAVEAAGSWAGRALDAWGATLARGEGAGPEPWTAPPGARVPSPHARVPLAALALGELREREGPEALLRVWESGAAGLAAPALDPTSGPGSEGRRREEPEDDAPLRRRRGICLAPANGTFLVSGLERSLQRAAELGATDVLIPVTAWPPGIGSSRPGERAALGLDADASDHELLAVCALARSAGLTPALRPHLLISESGGLHGEVHLAEIDRIEDYFDAFGAFLEHYALVAELGGCDLLVVGTGLSNATITEELDDPRDAEEASLRAERREGWKRVLDRVRARFSGRLTYAAPRGGPGWSGEAHRFALWSELDLLGVELFPSLAHLTDAALPPMRELKHRVERSLTWALDRGEEQGKPVLLTALGYPARADAWRHPWMAVGPVDVGVQRMLYDALAAVLPVAREHRSFAGLYLWRWSADPDWGGPDDGGFSPQNKPAEARVDEILK